MNNKRGLYSRIKKEKKMLILQNKKGIYPSTSLPEEAKFVQIVTLFTHLSLLLLLLLLCAYVLLILCLDPFLSEHYFPSIPLPLSYLNHPFSPNPYTLMTLSLLKLEEDGGRNLLSCDLHCSGHFLINAVDKTVVHHLM